VRYILILLLSRIKRRLVEMIGFAFSREQFCPPKLTGLGYLINRPQWKVYIIQ
jgi:hypothetical protein